MKRAVGARCIQNNEEQRRWSTEQLFIGLQKGEKKVLDRNGGKEIKREKRRAIVHQINRG